MPRVSIVTPLLDKGPFVAATIESVQGQTMSDWELLVVECGSTDDGPARVGESARDDTRVRLLEAFQRGPGAKRNLGVAHAQGEWILFLDADDLIEPWALTKRLASAEQAPAANLVVGGWHEFTDAEPGRREFRRPAACGGSSADVADRAIAGAPWALHAAMVRRSWLTDERRWQEALDGMPSEDTAFWFRVVLGAQMAWIEDSGALYRVATPGSRNDSRDVERWVNAVLEIISENVGFLRSQGREPNAIQCARILRGLEGNYRKALAQDASGPAQLTLAEAKRWLDRCPWWPAPLFARKLLGLELFNRLWHSAGPAAESHHS